MDCTVGCHRCVFWCAKAQFWNYRLGSSCHTAKHWDYRKAGHRTCGQLTCAWVLQHVYLQLGDCFVTVFARMSGRLFHWSRTPGQCYTWRWPSECLYNDGRIHTAAACLMPVLLSKEYLFWDSVLWHTHNVTDPTKLTFEQERFNTCSTTDLHHLCISDSILPLDTGSFTQTAKMELVQSLDWAPIHGPGLTAI